LSGLTLFRSYQDLKATSGQKITCLIDLALGGLTDPYAPAIRHIGISKTWSFCYFADAGGNLLQYCARKFVRRSYRVQAHKRDALAADENEIVSHAIVKVQIGDPEVCLLGKQKSCSSTYTKGHGERWRKASCNNTIYLVE